MDQVVEWLQYVRANPKMIVAGLAVIVVGFALLNRRTRLIRENARRFDELREERGEIYRNLRPPG